MQSKYAISEKKDLNHLFQSLVDDTGTSHISKPSGSPVAVAALCLPSDGKQFGNIFEDNTKDR